VPPEERYRTLGQSTASRSGVDRQARQEVEPGDENFFEAFGHRVKNTIDTISPPKWFQNVGESIKRPKWVGGNDEAESSRSGSDFTRWFGGGRQEGRVRL
jgi:hypothetical protein